MARPAKLIFGLLVLVGAATAQAEVPFKSIYPYSFEICALSQAARLNTKKEGPWGHSVLLVHGACRDEQEGVVTPRLKLCPPSDARTVAISVNSLLRNARWLMTEDEAFIFAGILQENQPLNDQIYELTRQKLVADRVFRGLQIYDDRASYGETFVQDPLKPLPILTPEERLAQSAVGIDTAFGYSRDAYCARMPVPARVMRDLLEFLNEENRRFESSDNFRWHFMRNNCAHLTHNALASVGVWEFRRTDLGWFEQLQNLAIPSHEFVRILKLGNPARFPGVLDVFKNRAHRDLLMTQNWLPYRPGTIARVQRMHQPNLLFDRTLDIFILDAPWGSLRKNFKLYTEDPKFQSLEGSLRRFEETYRRALADLKPVEFYIRSLEPLSSPEKREFALFYKKYQLYLESELRSVQLGLSRF